MMPHSPELQIALDAIEHALREPVYADYEREARAAGWECVSAEVEKRPTIYWRRGEELALTAVFACLRDGIVVPASRGDR